jgi:ketosteroid isomerase-like protein
VALAAHAAERDTARAMSKENVEIIRRMGIAFENGDWAAAVEPVHADIEMDTTRAPLHGLNRVYSGAEEVAGFWREWLEAWGAQQIEDLELIDAGAQVVMWTQVHELKGRGSGIEVNLPPYAWVMTLRDGKIVQATMYMDKAEALKAAGLSE